MNRLDDIPAAFEQPAEPRPSAVVAHLRSIRPNRRTVLRGLVIAAAAAALVPLDWYLARREAAAQETEGDDMSEYLTCAPESYREEANNWPATGPAVCYGGWRRGSQPCSGGYHREGTYRDGPDSAESTRVTTSCQGRNAWRWNGYRCSDAITTVTFADGTDYRGITIAACDISGEPATAAPSEPASRSTSPAPSDDAPSTGDGPSSSGGDGRDTSRRSDGDPSRPRRLLPALGSNSSWAIGSLLGGR